VHSLHFNWSSTVFVSLRQYSSRCFCFVSRFLPSKGQAGRLASLPASQEASSFLSARCWSSPGSRSVSRPRFAARAALVRAQDRPSFVLLASFLALPRPPLFALVCSSRRRMCTQSNLWSSVQQKPLVSAGLFHPARVASSAQLLLWCSLFIQLLPSSL
jgi:hypothetical protein